MVQQLQDIQDVIEQLRKICNRYLAIDRLVVYGSRARGENKITSDIDLCFFGELEREDYKIREEIEI